jgi:Protein of unknown function (DUF3617)
MKMVRHSTMAMALLALAACSKGPTVSATNASGEEVAAKVKAAGVGTAFVSPGHWQMAMTINEIKMPGMPPQFAEKMKAHTGAAKTFETCLTPEEAKKPGKDFFAKGNGECSYDKFSMGDGRIDAVMQCSEQGGKRLITMNGTYGGDAYHMALTSTGAAAGEGPMAGMSMKMEIAGKRTGECTGKEER